MTEKIVLNSREICNRNYWQRFYASAGREVNSDSLHRPSAKKINKADASVQKEIIIDSQQISNGKDDILKPSDIETAKNRLVFRLAKKGIDPWIVLETGIPSLAKVFAGSRNKFNQAIDKLELLIIKSHEKDIDWFSIIGYGFPAITEVFANSPEKFEQVINLGIKLSEKKIYSLYIFANSIPNIAKIFADSPEKFNLVIGLIFKLVESAIDPSYTLNQGIPEIEKAFAASQEKFNQSLKLAEKLAAKGIDPNLSLLSLSKSASVFADKPEIFNRVIDFSLIFAENGIDPAYSLESCIPELIKIFDNNPDRFIYCLKLGEKLASKRIEPGFALQVIYRLGETFKNEPSKYDHAIGLASKLVEKGIDPYNMLNGIANIGDKFINDPEIYDRAIEIANILTNKGIRSGGMINSLKYIPVDFPNEPEILNQAIEFGKRLANRGISLDGLNYWMFALGKVYSNRPEEIKKGIDKLELLAVTLASKGINPNRYHLSSLVDGYSNDPAKFNKVMDIIFRLEKKGIQSDIALAYGAATIGIIFANEPDKFNKAISKFESITLSKGQMAWYELSDVLIIIGKHYGSNIDKFNQAMEAVCTIREKSYLHGDPWKKSSAMYDAVWFMHEMSNDKPEIFKRSIELAIKLQAKGLDARGSLKEITYLEDFFMNYPTTFDQVMKLAFRLVEKGIDPSDVLEYGIPAVKEAYKNKMEEFDHAINKIEQLQILSKKVTSFSGSTIYFDGVIGRILQLNSHDDPDKFNQGIDLANNLLGKGIDPEPTLDELYIVRTVYSGNREGLNLFIKLTNILADNNIDPSNALNGFSHMIKEFTSNSRIIDQSLGLAFAMAEKGIDPGITLKYGIPSLAKAFSSSSQKFKKSIEIISKTPKGKFKELEKIFSLSPERIKSYFEKKFLTN